MLLPPTVDDPDNLASATIYLEYSASVLAEDEPISVPEPVAIHPTPVVEPTVEAIALLGLARRQATVVLLGQSGRARIAARAAVVIVEPIVIEAPIITETAIVIEAPIVPEATVSIKPRLLYAALQHLQALLQLNALFPVQTIKFVGALEFTQPNKLTLKASSFPLRNFSALE